MKGVAEEIKALEKRQEELDCSLRQLMLLLPNVPDGSVPVGDASANQEVRRVGEPKPFEFAPRAHWDLGPALGILDFERAAKISGSRFAVYSGLGARLERALAQLMLDLHISRGYREVIPPYLVTAETLLGIVEHYHLADLVGEPTAGTNGNVTSVRLPGRYSISFTGMKVLKHDGSRHHGIGILPTVPRSRTLAGIAAGRDEQLEKAIEVVSH